MLRKGLMASDARVDAPGRIHGISETKISFGRS
jgi:hypothetical protein